MSAEYTERFLKSENGMVGIRTYHAMPDGWREVERQSDSLFEGMFCRLLIWDNGFQTFHRADRSTRGVTTKRAPKTVWISKA